MNPKNSILRKLLVCTLGLSLASPPVFADFQYRVPMRGAGQAGPAPSPLALAASPGSLAFGGINRGSQSQMEVRISNPGTTAVALSNAAVSGAAFSRHSNTCTGTLAAGAECVVGVTYSATSVAQHTGLLRVTGGSGSAAVDVPLSGEGLALGSDVALTTNGAAALVASKPGPSATGSVVLTNQGDTAAALSFSGLSAPYSVSSSTCSAAANGGTCTVTVSMSTTGATGPQGSQTLLVTGAANGDLSVPVSGMLNGAEVSLDSNTAQALTAAKGGEAVSGVVTFRNAGNQAVSLSLGGLSAPYSLSSSTCEAAAGGTCAVTVTMATSGSVGTQPSQTLTASASGVSASAPVGGVLEGSIATVVTPAAVSLDPANYGEWAPSTQGWTIRNDGNAPMTLWVTDLTYPFGYGNDCYDIAPGSTCFIGVNMTSYAAPGNYSGTLSFSNAAQGNRSDLTVTGTMRGGIPTAQVSSHYLSGDYSTTNSGRPSANVAIVNTGNQTMTVSAYTNSVFTMTGNTCTNIAPAGSCAVTVEMNTNWYYSGGATQYGDLMLTAGNWTSSVSLHGLTLAAEAEWLGAGTLDFGTGAYGVTTTRTKQVRNNGNKAWSPENFVYNSPGVGNEVVSNASTACPSIAPGATCTVTFSYLRQYSRPNWTQHNVYLGPVPFGNVFTMTGNTP